jgi:hypothetical protein
MYVCVRICTYVCMYVHVSIYVYVYLYICIHTYKCTYIYTYIHICICTYICLYINTLKPLPVPVKAPVTKGAYIKSFTEGRKEGLKEFFSGSGPENDLAQKTLKLSGAGFGSAVLLSAVLLTTSGSVKEGIYIPIYVYIYVYIQTKFMLVLYIL